MYTCRICTTDLKQIIDFGDMPIANGFIKDPHAEEYTFNLAAFFCPKCLIVQIGETVEPEKMFHDHYQFISSTSAAMATHFQEQAEEIIHSLKEIDDPFVVELGSNDGIMLKHI